MHFPDTETFDVDVTFRATGAKDPSKPWIYNHQMRINQCKLYTATMSLALLGMTGAKKMDTASFVITHEWYK